MTLIIIILIDLMFTTSFSIYYLSILPIHSNLITCIFELLLLLLTNLLINLFITIISYLLI